MRRYTRCPRRQIMRPPIKSSSSTCFLTTMQAVDETCARIAERIANNSQPIGVGWYKDGVRTWLCGCGFKARTSKEWERHRIIMHRTFVCQKCSFVCAAKIALKRHVATHATVKLFTTCSKEFNLKEYSERPWAQRRRPSILYDFAMK